MTTLKELEARRDGAPTPELAKYRVLSSSAGVRVSPLVLGAMSLGTAWGRSMGSVDEQTAFQLLDTYAEMGGNFIDTANNYQDEQSETVVGQWMASRQNRDTMFVATKYTYNYRAWELGARGRAVNFGGNHRKSLHLSVRDSLHKLQTDYIDLLYLHFLDWTTSIEEIMDALHMLVEQGKVLYLGVSDAPAWFVAAANMYARAAHKTPFSVYQGRWNVLLRDFERDIIPMARHFGMAICPWDVLCQGRLQSEAQVEARRVAASSADGTPARSAQQSEREQRMSAALEQLAVEIGGGGAGAGAATVQQLALAYVRHKAHNVFPLVGMRKLEHLQDNVGALELRLTDAQIAFIEGVEPFDVGFPTDPLGGDPRVTGKVHPIAAAAGTVLYTKDTKPLDLW